MRAALTEPVHLIAANAGYDADEVVKQVSSMAVDEGFDALQGRFGEPARTRCHRSAAGGSPGPPERRVGGRAALTTDSLVAEEQTPWNKSLMTEIGQLDEGCRSPRPMPARRSPSASARRWLKGQSVPAAGDFPRRKASEPGDVVRRQSLA